MTLAQCKIGEKHKIIAVTGHGVLRRRLLDMGLTPKTDVMIRKVAPMGDPIEIHLRGYELTIRLDDAKKIVVSEEAVK
ncbi:MAG: ferrous iron transport protein A [Clostridia bacterium]|nr:ferrous iron transport protein A [Clostridia bacterium]MCI1958357.1 ferrous iron transport protein A [Clostridia bacterium]MCI2001103.1 ferrous iron transport protein A [Clostridia bacterium]MCI2015771.1 ferrous iron transport protein A [Clostridia bacterium]